MGEAALRASVAVSPITACLLIAAGLAASWALTYAIGGANTVVPHWFYLPILFAAVRFGPLVAALVALVSGIIAGPLTYLDVAAASSQDADRWLTRTGFFLVVGVAMALLVRSSLPSVVDEVRRRRDAQALHRALQRDELFVRFQPVVELSTGRLHALEALVRWQDPERGELGPGWFLPTAERSEVINELGDLVFGQACRQAARWCQLADRAGTRPVCVTVNMSARELASPVLVERIRDQLHATGVDPSLICIEVTESSLVEDLDVSVARLAALKTLGVQLAVDDFGTGYSSLSSVHRFPIDVLKVDRSFVAALDRDEDARRLLGGLVLFARTIRLTMVAEGVETPEQAATVHQLGYDLGQGYHFAPPLLAGEIDELVAKSPRWWTSDRSDARS